MAKRTLFSAVVAVATALVAGCAGAPAAGSGVPGSISLSPTRSGNAFVLGGEQLWERSSDLLSLIANRISAVQVRRSGQCPVILMRGQKTYLGSTDPDIYVNGARAGNTCLLEMMRSEDVERVEVYPMGVTNRPGVAMNPNGVIMIFLRTADSDLGAEGNARERRQVLRVRGE